MMIEYFDCLRIATESLSELGANVRELELRVSTAKPPPHDLVKELNAKREKLMICNQFVSAGGTIRLAQDEAERAAVEDRFARYQKAWFDIVAEQGSYT